MTTPPDYTAPFLDHVAHLESLLSGWGGPFAGAVNVS
jgi:hypothetical protein